MKKNCSRDWEICQKLKVMEHSANDACNGEHNPGKNS